jgi:hypothetical protein
MLRTLKLATLSHNKENHNDDEAQAAASRALNLMPNSERFGGAQMRVHPLRDYVQCYPAINYIVFAFEYAQYRWVGLYSTAQISINKLFGLHRARQQINLLHG